MKNITTTKLTNKMPKDLQYSRYEYFIWRGRKMYTIFFYTNESLLSREPRVFTLQWISDIKKRTKSSPIQKKTPIFPRKNYFLTTADLLILFNFSTESFPYSPNEKAIA